uniref:DNA damage regulated autophagy modulator 1 n=1 Tax=Gopherus evgoodei TaxID=1825980 RepID=A0A8C4WR24_9SAUR
MLCFMPGVAFIPALLVCWSSAAFIISYVIAVLGGHVEPLVPYISDTGTKPPESGIFGFMINISAFLGAATMYIRYLIIEKQNESSNFMSPSCNLITLCIGLLGCIGMGIVANFQELSVPSVHDGGALVAFGSGVVYITLQSVISFKSCPQWNSHSTCYVRMAISIVSWIAVIPSILFAYHIVKHEWPLPDLSRSYTLVVSSAFKSYALVSFFFFFGWLGSGEESKGDSILRDSQ